MDMKYTYLPRLVSNLYTIYFTQGPICENVSFNCKLELTKTRCLKAIKNRNIFIERNLVNKHKSCGEFFIYFFLFYVLSVSQRSPVYLRWKLREKSLVPFTHDAQPSLSINKTSKLK